MIKITKIAGVWAVVNDKSRDIIECFDTRVEADEYFEPIRIHQTLVDFDKIRNWESLWDIEQRPDDEQKKKAKTGTQHEPDTDDHASCHFDNRPS